MCIDGSETIREFDRWAPTYDASVAASVRYYERYEEVLGFVAETARARPGRRVLDIGAGTGNLSVRCAGKGASVVGVDPSAGMLEQARGKAVGGLDISFVRASDPFVRLPFADGSFDAAVSTYAFHHVPNDRKPRSVREMLRVLRPDGIMVIGDLAFRDVESEAAALREYDWLEAEHFTRIDEISRSLMDCGAELGSRQFTRVTWVVWAERRWAVLSSTPRPQPDTR